jgi:hypothetical protein
MNGTRTYDHQLFNVFLHIPNAPDQVTHGNGMATSRCRRNFGCIDLRRNMVTT